jgi:hypothetical protein
MRPAEGEDAHIRIAPLPTAPQASAPTNAPANTPAAAPPRAAPLPEALRRKRPARKP